jgi:polysaccharide biosynthesis PFTS motif protein
MTKINNFKLSKNFSVAIKMVLYKKLVANSPYIFTQKRINFDPNRLLEQVIVSKKEKFKIILICIILLLIYIFLIFKINHKNKHAKVILVYSLSKDQAYKDYSLKSLSDFFASKRFLLDTNTAVWVEIRKPILNQSYKNMHSTIDIPIKIYADKFSLNEKLVSLFEMCNRLVTILMLIKSNNYPFMVIKEYVFDEVVYKKIKPVQVSKIITTQSHITYQPIIFELESMSGKRVMLWYSCNSMTMPYRKLDLKRYELNDSVYAYLKIDEHWVWTKEHSNFLSKITDKKILIKKSMMFYNPMLSNPKNKTIDILIFDVTPSSYRNVSRNSIYTDKNMIKFINEIVNVCEVITNKNSLNLSIYLKSKREYSKHHSIKYIKFIHSLEERGLLKTLNSTENLYDLVKKTRVVIGIPFTSPVAIGHELKVPSVFYSSSSLLKYSPNMYEIPLIQSTYKLEKFLTKVLVGNK